MTKKFFLNFKNKLFLFLITIFFVLNVSQTYALIYSEGSSSSKQSSFNPNDYEIDYSQKHNSKFWRHEDGHAFATNARVFCDISGMKMVPCRTYQEYANKSQIASNAVGIALNFFPPFKGVYGTAKFLLAEKYVDSKDDCVAMINDIVRYYALNDPGKVFFFFDSSQLDEIKKVDITFCDCDMSPSLITSVINFVNDLTAFLENANFDDLIEKLLLKGEFSETELSEMGLQNNDLGQKIITKEIKTKVKNYIKKKINQKVGHAIAKNAFKKGTKKVVGNTWGKIFSLKCLKLLIWQKKNMILLRIQKKILILILKITVMEKH